jgi:hypothetical protein
MTPDRHPDEYPIRFQRGRLSRDPVTVAILLLDSGLRRNDNKASNIWQSEKQQEQ